MKNNTNDNSDKNYNASTDDFLFAIVTKVMSGDDLLDFDRKKLAMRFWGMAYDISMPVKDFTKTLKKFKQAIPNFLKVLDEVLDEAEKMGLRNYEINEQEFEKIKNLPPLANTQDAPQVIAFIRQLDKDLYNYSEAAKLLGVTRQTLKTYTEDENHTLKRRYSGKSWYITKESIVWFYRNRFDDENDHLPF